MPIDDDGEFIPPAKTYLDDIEVYDAELGGVVPAWKSLIYHGAKARRFAQLTAIADSASAVDQESGIKQPPPLVADAVVAQAETDVARRIMDLIDALNRRMDALEEKASAEERRAKADEALELLETLAETAPKELLAILPARPDRRLH